MEASDLNQNDYHKELNEIAGIKDVPILNEASSSNDSGWSSDESGEYEESEEESYDEEYESEYDSSSSDEQPRKVKTVILEEKIIISQKPSILNALLL